MALSVTNPISAALDRTKRILFKPFDIGKWFVLGFCAFLAGPSRSRSTGADNCDKATIGRR